MTGEAKGDSKNDENKKNANQTVSSIAELSQTNCENTDIAVQLKSDVCTIAKGGKNDGSGTSSGDRVSNEVQNKNSNGAAVTGETAKTKSTENVEEIEEEDVPGDFFDDFLKEDFMEGLDIVDDDAWDEDKLKKEVVEQDTKSVPVTKSVETKKKKKLTSKKAALKKPTKQSASKNDLSDKVSVTPLVGKKLKQKKKKQEEKESEQKRKRSKEKVIDADEFDIRRDPEKTKRDIERDKARCEKDKEKKIISEKLNLVETGLVPPGMEMETDIEEIKRQKGVIEQNKPPRDLRERLRTLRSKSKSPLRRQRSPKRKSPPRRSLSPLRKISPKRRRTRSPIRKRSRSVGRQSPARRTPHRSPLNADTQKRTSPRRISPIRSPLRSAPRRSSERGVTKRSPRRSRSISPYYRNRRRYSPRKRRNRSSSRESDREMWLRRRRSRSRSRRRREEKKSFLQELAEKLNETRPQPVNLMPQLQPVLRYVHPQPSPTVPAPVPAPVPPPTAPVYFPRQPQSRPQSQPQTQTQYDPYDQNFFIGTPQPVAAPNFIVQPQPKALPAGGLIVQKQLALNSSLVRPVISPHMPVTSIPVVGNVVSRNIASPAVQTPAKGKGGTQGELEKLFQDKKIKLSEFLAVTAKPEVSSSSPALLQEKIKVISRCQEAIKILGTNEQKYTGTLIVRRTEDYKMSEQKNTSPLIRMPPVVFPFTHHQTNLDQKITFSNFVNQLLQKIGMMKEAVVDVEDDASSKAGIPPPTRNLSPPPPPLITRARGIANNEVKISRPNLLASNQLSKMVQTDVFKCDACETRKKILYKSSSVQCGGEKTIYSVSTQVTENDFISKIPVIQSLASLTPAQLLAKSRGVPDSSGVPAKFGSGRGVDKDDFDISPTKTNYGNRPGFSRAATAADPYNLPRYSSPSPPLLYDLPGHAEALSPAMYGALAANALRSQQFIGGGGRGRATQPNQSRTLDSNRYNYNNYY